MHKMIQAGVLLCAGSLAACSAAVRQPPPGPPSSPPPIPAAETRGASIFTVSPQASEVNILVFSGGALARLGHNHVVSSTTVSGRVWLHPRFERSGFELSIPVEKLVVDDPQSRRAAGSGFPPDVEQAAKDGTRKNMLGPQVLDAERYPTISVRSARVSGTPQAPRFTARITIKDVSRDVEVPVTLALGSARLSATGELDVQQTDFGMKPFTAALGALQVQDRLHITFRIVAQRQQ